MKSKRKTKTQYKRSGGATTRIYKRVNRVGTTSQTGFFRICSLNDGLVKKELFVFFRSAEFDFVYFFSLKELQQTHRGYRALNKRLGKEGGGERDAETKKANSKKNERGTTKMDLAREKT
jgi:hypothetical protein